MAVSPELWDRARAIFDEAVSLPMDQRQNLLDSASIADSDLRALVDQMLRNHDTAGSFLESPIIDANHLFAVEGGSVEEAFVPGAIIANRFRIVRRLGAGGMGEVYEAVDELGTGERVALKTIRHSIRGGARMEEQLRAELHLARKITHPNVSRVHEFFVHESAGASGSLARLCFFSMELLEGETLRERIRRDGALSPSEVEDILPQLVDGLAAAHRNGIVHGDFKSGNIFLSADSGKSPRAVITDFGLAKPADRESSGQGIFGGTPGYMAPEQRHGKPAMRAWDVYSFGIIAVEMLTGQIPKSDALEHSPEGLRKLRKLLAGTSSPWVDVIIRSLQPLPHRYPDAPAMAAGRDRSVKLQRSRRLILSACGLGGLLLYAGRLWWSNPPLPDGGAVVVLPFLAGNGLSGMDYFIDGIADEVIGTLSRTSLIRVVSRHSSFQYKDKTYDLNLISTKLNADLILKGNIRQIGNELLAEVQLWSGSRNHRLWSAVVKVPTEDGYRLPREIAELVAQRMQRPIDKHLVHGARQSPSPMAYDLYLKGLHFRYNHSSENVLKSLGYFQQAVDAQPDFAEAWASLGDAYQFLAGGLLPIKEASQKARDAAAKALELDKTLALAHQTQGSVSQRLNWDWKTAGAEFRRALELEPSNARIHHVYAGYLSNLGRHDEAIREIGISRMLDPLSVPVNTGQAIYYYFARRYDDVIRQGQRVLELDPEYFRIYSFLAYAHLAKGDVPKAMEYFEKGPLLAPKDLFLQAHLAYACFHTGKTARGEALLQKLLQNRTLHPFYVALIYCGAGKRKLAMEWLEKAYAERDPSITLLKVHPLLDSLREEPAFSRLLEKIGLK